MTTDSDAAVNSLIHMLSAWDRKSSDKALEMLHSMTAGEYFEMIEIEEDRHSRFHHRWSSRFIKVAYVSIIACIVVMLIFGPSEILAITVPSCGLAVMAQAFVRRSLDKGHKRFLAAMAHHAVNPDAAPYMLDELDYPSHLEEKSVVQAMAIALNAMPEKYDELVNIYRREQLVSLLAHPYSEYTLTVAILKLFKRIGGAEALAAVDGLANELPLTQKMRTVRAAARDCLPHVAERANRELQGDTLLRASELHPELQEELLRPVQQAPLDRQRAELPRVAPEVVGASELRPAVCTNADSV